MRLPVRLHQNELPWSLPPDLADQLAACVRRLAFNRYPEAYAPALAHRLANWYDCSPRQVMVGPGSSSFIQLLLTYYGLRPSGQIVITRPSFAYCEQFCRAFGLSYSTWELDDAFQYNPSALGPLLPGSLVYLASPNNPTGSVITPAQLEPLLGHHSESLFVVDEAYAEFGTHTLLPLLDTHPNLIILKTFSKAFAASGIRCGALIAAAPRIEQLTRLQTPWQLPAFTIEAGCIILDYLQASPWLQNHLRLLTAERESLRHQLAQDPAGTAFTIYPSQANFLLLKAHTRRAHAALTTACARRHILIQDLDGELRLTRCLRITIGTPAENQLFLKAFQDTSISE